MLEKLSSVSIMSDASFATSVPAIPWQRVRQFKRKVEASDRIDANTTVGVVWSGMEILEDSSDVLCETLLKTLVDLWCLGVIKKWNSTDWTAENGSDGWRWAMFSRGGNRFVVFLMSLSKMTLVSKCAKVLNLWAGCYHCWGWVALIISCYHGKAHISLLQSWSIISSISCYCDNLPLFYDVAVNDAWRQRESDDSNVDMCE